jgi:nucleotide-binding universal stress UspA family protein
MWRLRNKRKRKEMAMFKTILVAVDGADNARQAASDRGADVETPVLVV